MQRYGSAAMRLIVLLILLAPLVGCGTAKNLYHKVRPERSELRKRVLVLPMLDQQGLAEGQAEALTTRLVEHLERDRNLVVYRNEEPLPTTIKSGSPKFGVIVDPDLAQKAEEMGMNVLITCVLNRYEVVDHGAGLWPVNQIPVWPFTRKEPEVEISMVVNALDITNGTLFLTHMARRNLKVPREEEKAEDLIIQEREPRSDRDMIQAVPDREKEEAFEDLLEEQAETIAESLSGKAWAGRVLSAGDGRIMINAGLDVGVSEGRVFEVYSRGDAIQSATGRSMYLLGSKVGEIRTVRVLERYASAEPLEGDEFRAGQVIREKK